MGKILRYEPRAAMVDQIGIGWGITGNLQTRLDSAHTTILGVNVGEHSSDEDKFFRLRDELCWRVRERFEAGTISIPDDPLFIAETTTIKYRDDHQGNLIKVESKKDMQKRGLGSPNRFDALMLAHYWQATLLRDWSRREKSREREHEPEGSWRTV